MELTDLRFLQEKIDKIIGVVGSKSFLHFLRVIHPDNSDNEPELEERIYLFIVHCVGIYYKIPFDNIIGSSVINGRTTRMFNDERQICYYLICKHLGYSVRRICDIFKKDKKNVHEGIKKIEYHMDTKTKFPDKKLIEDIIIIDNQIIEFKAIAYNGNIKEKKTVR